MLIRVLKVKLPAEPEDWQKRPAYIHDNAAGVPICENRYNILTSLLSFLLNDWLPVVGFSTWYTKALFYEKGK
jgi:hypothetical protein